MYVSPFLSPFDLLLTTLPRQLSDRKYKSMMRMIDVALPKFDDPAPPTTTSASGTLEVPRFIGRRSSAFVQSREAAQNEEEYHVLQEEEEEEDAGGKKDEFFDVEELDVVSSFPLDPRVSLMASPSPELEPAPEDIRIHVPDRPRPGVHLPLCPRPLETRSSPRQRRARGLPLRVRAPTVRHVRRRPTSLAVRRGQDGRRSDRVPTSRHEQARSGRGEGSRQDQVSGCAEDFARVLDYPRGHRQGE